MAYVIKIGGFLLSKHPWAMGGRGRKALKLKHAKQFQYYEQAKKECREDEEVILASEWPRL